MLFVHHRCCALISLVTATWASVGCVVGVNASQEAQLKAKSLASTFAAQGYETALRPDGFIGQAVATKRLKEKMGAAEAMNKGLTADCNHIFDGHLWLFHFWNPTGSYSLSEFGEVLFDLTLNQDYGGSKDNAIWSPERKVVEDTCIDSMFAAVINSLVVLLATMEHESVVSRPNENTTCPAYSFHKDGVSFAILELLVLRAFVAPTLDLQGPEAPLVTTNISALQSAGAWLPEWLQTSAAAMEQQDPRLRVEHITPEQYSQEKARTRLVSLLEVLRTDENKALGSSEAQSQQTLDSSASAIQHKSLRLLRKIATSFAEPN